jgi:hypothetical protein
MAGRSRPVCYRWKTQRIDLVDAILLGIRKIECIRLTVQEIEQIASLQFRCRIIL